MICEISGMPFLRPMGRSQERRACWGSPREECRAKRVEEVKLIEVACRDARCADIKVKRGNCFEVG